MSLMQEVSPASSTQTTPSHAPTPTSSQAAPVVGKENERPTPMSAGGVKGGERKKSRKGAEREEDEAEGKVPKRLNFTYGRGGAGE